jgi:hypothetical protein
MYNPVGDGGLDESPISSVLDSATASRTKSVSSVSSGDNGAADQYQLGSGQSQPGLILHHASTTTVADSSQQRQGRPSRYNTTLKWGCGLCSMKGAASRFNAERHIWYEPNRAPIIV